MGLKYDARLDLSTLSDALEKRGLTPGGRVQKAVDEAVIRYCDPKVPFRTGTLKHSAITASAIGDGMIVYATPYARYLYYGEVYGPNIPIFEGGELAGFFSPPHKYPTGRPLTYNGAPDRGAYWFERPWPNTRMTSSAKPPPWQEGDPEDERTGCYPRLDARTVPPDQQAGPVQRQLPGRRADRIHPAHGQREPPHRRAGV